MISKRSKSQNYKIKLHFRFCYADAELCATTHTQRLILSARIIFHVPSILEIQRIKENFRFECQNHKMMKE